MPTKKLPLVWFIGTGGTISDRSRLTVMQNLERIREIKKHVERAPDLHDFVRVKAEHYGQLGFPSPTDSLKIARRINQIFREEPETAGVVVTHGTAIMEETAYFLNLLVKSDKPVVVTGAMRSPSFLGTDGENNLLDAAIVARSPESRGKGVLLLLNNEINAARDVTKTNSYSLQTFSSRDLGVLGYAAEEDLYSGDVGLDAEPVYYRAPTRKHTYQTEFDPDKIKEFPRVELVYCSPATDAMVINYLAEQKVPGLVWAGAGAGGGPPEATEALYEARKKGVIVVIATRGGSGRVVRNANYKERGIIVADNLIPVKAVALLMTALTVTKDAERIQQMFYAY